MGDPQKAERKEAREVARQEKQEAKEQRDNARKVVTSFVSEHVRGKKLKVVLCSGELQSCAFALSRSLDSFTIKLGKESRSISLSDVSTIHAGPGLDELET